MEEKIAFNSCLDYSAAKLKDASILSLSFIGDSVHTLFIRSKLFEKFPYDNNVLHIKTSKEVNANKQSVLAKAIEKYLDEDEMFIFKKGKNAHVNSIPKHSDLVNYKNATAFEAIVGYLYLQGKNDRLNELLNKIYDEVGFED